jgi:hypothetical protein
MKAIVEEPGPTGRREPICECGHSAWSHVLVGFCCAQGCACKKVTVVIYKGV